MVEIDITLLKQTVGELYLETIALQRLVQQRDTELAKLRLLVEAIESNAKKAAPETKSNGATT